MKLTLEGLRERSAWEQAGIALPAFDAAALAAHTRQNPGWVHFGIGNIFRIFLGGIAQQLISRGSLSYGITCVESFDFEVVDKIYRPFDNLALAVTLRSDGSRRQEVLGSLCEAVAARGDEASRARLKEIFTAPGLQMVTFTITEKGYALKDPAGAYLPYIRKDLDGGPAQARTAMGLVCALMWERFQAGARPLALVSCDNVSQNGRKLRESVLEVARVWQERGAVSADFVSYLSDERQVSFPWTMIDKITPRPAEQVGKDLRALGVEDMEVVVTSCHTYIAPFVNAEEPGYLVIEDNFPNGRPPLEQAGVFMADRNTVNLSERMKVTVCLNPIHTALCTYDCLLGYRLFADGMHDHELDRLARRLGYDEGLPVVEDPGILSPRAFLDELMTERFPNAYMGDTSARIAVDISQMVGIRFGHTIGEYVKRRGSASALVAVPLAIAGWIRYLLAVDDKGQPFELSPDPLLPWLKEQLSGVRPGDPASLKGKLTALLSNSSIFGLNLYEAGLGEKIEGMVAQMLAGPGAVRATLKAWLD